MKKRITFLAVLVALAVSLAGCGAYLGSGQAAAPKPTTAIGMATTPTPYQEEPTKASEPTSAVATTTSNPSYPTATAVTGTDSGNATCSNQGVRGDNDPAVHPQGWTLDTSHSYILHVWSNFRSQNLNPQNFPPPNAQTTQHEFILYIPMGQGATLPPGTGGSSWQYDCDAQGWADYNREQKLEGFVPITIAQIQAYYNSGNPWGTAAVQPAPQATVVASSQTCSADSIGDPIDHPAVKGQTWTLPGNMAYVVHVWSNQFDPNLDTKHFTQNGTSKQNEFIYVTSIGPDVVFPVGTGGKAYPYACNASAQADYVNQMKVDGFVPITWEQLQSYSRTGQLN